MPSIITGILSSTVGLLWNKVLDKTAEKLQDGDVTDAKLRELVVREMNDIKTKLDALSRKDLLSSYIFLQEGVDLLNVTLDKFNLEEKALPNHSKNDGSETSTMSSTVGSDVLNEVLKLSHAVGKIKLDSDKEFESAKKRFEDARRKATEAFCNEALSIKDRIFATKLRIVSDILECLDNPEIAITGCLSFLKKFHSLPAIQEIFNVYVNGGVWSLLNKDERVENVKSVMMINYVLFQYVLKFSSKNPALFWPTIKLADRSFYPILEWTLISQRKSMGKELDQHPGRVVFLHDEEIHPRVAAVNSHCEVIVRKSDHFIKIISRTGETKTVELPGPQKYCNVRQYSVTGLAVDKNDMVYVGRLLKTQTERGSCAEMYTLSILDKNYSVIHEYLLDFLQERDSLTKMAINKNNDIIISQEEDPYVYICDDVGQLKHKFQTTSFENPFALAISEKNEIITYVERRSVEIYTEEGNLKSTIKLPRRHHVMSVAFHHVMGKIIVLTCKVWDDLYFLLRYLESGELETTMFVCDDLDFLDDDIAITSHPSGTSVVVTNESITFI